MTEVLIIDDEIDISESISAILQDEGLSCTTVSNSFDAIDSIHKVTYDLIKRGLAFWFLITKVF